MTRDELLILIVSGVVVFFLLLPQIGRGDDFSMSEGNTNQLWVTSGMWSRHNNEDHYHYRQNNTGLGLAYETPKYTFVVGEYDNSIKQHSDYFGVMHTPLKIGPVKIGYFAGLISGYTKNVKFFPMAAPMATYEYKGIGINFIWVPSVVAAVQLKIKVW